MTRSEHNLQQIARDAAERTLETLDTNGPAPAVRRHICSSLADAVAVAVLQHLRDVAQERGGVYRCDLSDALKEIATGTPPASAERSVTTLQERSAKDEIIELADPSVERGDPQTLASSGDQET
jgi:hypothetical protein